MPLTPGIHHTAINNLPYQYIILSTSPAKPVILIHPSPWGISAGPYTKWFTRLSRHYTVVIPSTRGTDGSAPPPSEPEMSSRHIISDVESLRSLLGITKFHAMIGHSAGGIIAIGYAIMYPDRVNRLIPIDSDLLGYERTDLSFFTDTKNFTGSAPTDDKSLAKYAYDVAPLYFVHPSSNKNLVRFRETLEGGRMSFWVWKAFFAADTANASSKAAWYEREVKWRQIDELSQVKAKTLVIVGREDRCCEPEISSVIARGVQKGVLAVIDACGHFPWIEREDEFWSMLEGFLEEDA
jgi:proline iminopeptidase